jgi:hypothetical protein
MRWLPNAVKDLQFHARSPFSCACKAYVIGKIFGRPLQPFEENAKTELLELILTNVIGPIQTWTILIDGGIIVFADNHSM